MTNRPTIKTALLAAGLALACAATPVWANAAADCEAKAAEKKLAGAAKTSFVKKCSGGSAAAKSPAAEKCEAQAAEKKLHGGRSFAMLASAKCTNEENFLLAKLTRQLMATNSIDHCARL